MDRVWDRPRDIPTARSRMIEAESRGDFRSAALAAITLADLTSGSAPLDAESFDRQAQVYATLHQADTAVRIAERRRVGPQ